jgi:hypothetical protein
LTGASFPRLGHTRATFDIICRDRLLGLGA